MKDFKQNKEALNKELEQFQSILDEILPRYTSLLKKEDLSTTELTELGEIEHYLIEVNSKISTIKNMLEEDLFGLSLDIYYKLKIKFEDGDINAGMKLARLKKNFQETLEGGSIFNWN